jgi:hypothetical protein
VPVLLQAFGFKLRIRNSTAVEVSCLAMSVVVDFGRHVLYESNEFGVVAAR